MRDFPKKPAVECHCKLRRVAPLEIICKPSIDKGQISLQSVRNCLAIALVQHFGITEKVGVQCRTLPH
jgi:hypothetical protein